MSYRSSLFFAKIQDEDMPVPGEVHVYDTFDPTVLREGQRTQRRINVRIPGLFDLDEEITESGEFAGWPKCPACGVVMNPACAVKGAT